MAKAIKKLNDLNKHYLSELNKMRDKQIVVHIVSVDKIHDIRHFRFYYIDDNRLWACSYLIAKVTGEDLFEGEVIVEGGGMDMVFAVLSNFNSQMQYLKEGKGVNYSDYWINADRYQLV